MTMRDRSDRYQIQTIAAPARPKRIGGYLLEAGLLTTDQVDVALNDQRATGMKFGEVVVARGWIKEQTIEWIVQKVIGPERKAFKEWETQAIEQQRAALTIKPSLMQPQSPARPPAAPPASAAKAPAAQPPRTAPSNSKPANPNITNGSGNPNFVRREVPIAKPLPPVNSSDNDVNWVG